MFTNSTCVLTRVLILLIAVSFWREGISNKIGYFTFVVPGTIRSESYFHVSLTLSDFHRSCWFQIRLKNYNQTLELLDSEGIEIKPGTSQLVKLRAPYLYDKLGRIEIIGYRGIVSIKSALINFETNTFSIFIQTNKPKFKPGELVEFRVICIDQLTRPANISEKIFVKIYDGQDNLLKQFDEVKLVQGVFRSEFQISDYPVLGEWQLVVEIQGDFVAENRFEVARYVLPKFYVEIKTNPNVGIDEDKIILDINSRYFHGEPVRGNLTISVDCIYSYFEFDSQIFTTQLLDINGNARIILDMKKDLNLLSKNEVENSVSLILYKFKVEATLIDDMTEDQIQAETDITIHSQPYKIKLKTPELFHPDKLITFKINFLITDLNDNPIEDLQNPVKILLECKRPKKVNFKSEYSYEIGINSAIIQITNENFKLCYLEAKYRDSKSPRVRVEKNCKTFFLEILTKSPEVGKQLEILVRSLHPIGNFSYEIVSRGDIIQSELINVPGNQTSYILRFDVTFLMVPKITIYVHGIKNNTFTAQLEDVFIKRTFKNSIKIQTKNEKAKPGSAVNINVTTDENSYLGLMGIDHRILESHHVDDDELSEDNFYMKLQNYDSISFADSAFFPGAIAGLVTITNAFRPTFKLEGWGDEEGKEKFSSGDSGGPMFISPKPIDKPTLYFPYVRKVFSDSWLFKDFERTPKEGLNFIETMPDTITTWAITGFSLNPNTGLTLTKNPTKLKVFQEFFISMDLPTLVREGEIIEIPVHIRNYMNEDVWTNVTLKSSNTADVEVLEYSFGQVSTSTKELSKHILVRKLEKIIFYLKARRQGRHIVTVQAVSSRESDEIQKILHVQPHGIPHKMSKVFSVTFPIKESQDKEVTIDIPEQAVSESQRIEISVVGDIFRPLMKRLEKMGRVPYGNSEDNIKHIVSNLLVLKYLKALNYSKPIIESKIGLNLELGYQNQLAFQHLDGSFGSFESISERTGDVWQTALALWGLKQASDYVQIESKVIKRGLYYLKSKQQKCGCFDSGRGIRTTAFVLIVLLMENFPKTAYSQVIFKGFNCLFERSTDLDNSFDSAILAYVLLLGKRGKNFEDGLNKFFRRKKELVLTKPDTLESNLESTAKILVNLFETQKDNLNQSTRMFDIVKEFVNLEDKDSALIHLIALKELVEFIGNLQMSRRNLTISLRDDQNTTGSFQIGAENYQVLQTLKISRKCRKIKFKIEGYGFAKVSIDFKYNLLPEHQVYSSVFLSNITTSMSEKRLRVLEFCSSSFSNKNQGRSNSMVMEITLQSGYVLSQNSLLNDKLYSDERVTLIHSNNNKDTIEVYLKNMDSVGLCFKLKVLREFKILNAKPGWISFYDEFKKDLKTIQTFMIHDEL